jgi:hypothetical protein
MKTPARLLVLCIASLSAVACAPAETPDSATDAELEEAIAKVESGVIPDVPKCSTRMNGMGYTAEGKIIDSKLTVTFGGYASRKKNRVVVNAKYADGTYANAWIPAYVRRGEPAEVPIVVKPGSEFKVYAAFNVPGAPTCALWVKS